MVSVSRRLARRILPIGVLCLFCYIFFKLYPIEPSRTRATFIPSSFDWSKVPQTHPLEASEIASLPKGEPRKLPRVQHPFRTDKSAAGRERDGILLDRREQVKQAFVKSWGSYKRHAWMFDELTPVSGKGKDPFGGWAATLVDALDTLWIMDLKVDFHLAASAVASLDWAATTDTGCNFFETTIRHLGGLLSAYDLSQEPALLRKAQELGDMLYMAFDTPTRMPPFWLNFEHARTGKLLPGTRDPSASVTSSSLEFTRLAQLTGDDKYYDAIDRVTRLLDQTQELTNLPGMWPTFFNLRDMIFDRERQFTLGALADSLYELLPKMFALLGGREPVYEKLYVNAMKTIKRHLLFRPMLPDQADILFTGDAFVKNDGSIYLRPEGQHLSCFVGGMFTLGGKLLNIEEHVTIGEKITRGCVWMYDAMPSGIMPEIYGLLPCPTLDACAWNKTAWELESDQTLKKGVANARDPRYLLRPEAIESVFIMYRITGDPEYQEMAWRMFKAIREATETDLAFSAIPNVTVQSGGTQKLDSMESFWLAETLKYFYLIFSPPDLISLDEYVLNTEAHPLRRPR
ncbi:glycoside hydrolase family 47 protein [Xylariaceae sp. FL0255]|nr:glycoside hydrolase family 47 protein [Xylariaceae sp. FL0255]